MDEPLPPEGIDPQALNAAIIAALGVDLGQAFVQWRDVDWPTWARNGWRRLQQGQDKCPTP